MPKTALSKDISGRMIFLGTGTSVGVPAIGCDCNVCQSDNPRNNRSRCSVILGLPEGNLLVDTSPDLRSQLLREQIALIHAVAFTHEHADHIFGLDDLRLVPFYTGQPVTLFCEDIVEKRIRHSFDYAFSDIKPTHAGAVPNLEFARIATEPFSVLGATVVPIRLKHGPRFDVLGFRVGNIAYCTDTNHIPDESWPKLQGLDVFVIDALRHDPHITHFSLDEAIEAAERVGAKQTYFTHCSHAFDYDLVNDSLPAGMQLAYDGLSIPLSL